VGLVAVGTQVAKETDEKTKGKDKPSCQNKMTFWTCNIIGGPFFTRLKTARRMQGRSREGPSGPATGKLPSEYIWKRKGKQRQRREQKRQTGGNAIKQQNLSKPRTETKKGCEGTDKRSNKGKKKRKKSPPLGQRWRGNQEIR